MPFIDLNFGKHNDQKKDQPAVQQSPPAVVNNTAAPAPQGQVSDTQKTLDPIVPPINVVETSGPAFSNASPQVQNSTGGLPPISNTLPSDPSTLGASNPPVSGQPVSPSNQPIGTQNNLVSNNLNIGSYLDLTETRGASDLHFSVGYPPMIRIDGSLEKIGAAPLTQEEAEKLLMPILTDFEKTKLENERELDFSYEHKSGVRFRINLYHEKDCLAGAFRLIPAKIRTISELKLPEILYDFLNLPHGLVLVTGPTGSGKSTSLAAMLSEINLNQKKHIITLEDPIEYLYGKGQSLVDQREIGRDSLSWEKAMRSILRQDPDVVLVGEMRDYKTIASAITVAETGHLVFATLHTNSAAESIDRIIDVFPEFTQQQIRAQLAQVIVAVVSQRLVPLKQGGRVAASEVLVGTSAVKNSIRESKTYQIDNIIQTGADVGMFPLEKSLAELVKTGRITLDSALEATVRPKLLKDLLQ